MPAVQAPDTIRPDLLRILYVDDEPDLLEIVKLMLEHTGGFVVDTAASPADARRILAQETYDAIVSDYQMPDEDGIAFLKSIRKSPSDIPFLLFTGRGREDVVITAIDSGVDFYVQKGGQTNAQFAELAHKIRQSVMRRQHDTRRRVAEEALKESEAKFSMLFQNSPAILSLIDAGDTTFVDVNDAFVRRLGFSREEIIGKTLVTAGLFVEIPDNESLLKELHATGKIMAREVRFRTKAGEIRTCIFSLVVISIGGSPYYLTSAEDISDRKAMETTLVEQHLLLEEAMALANMADWELDSRTGELVFNDRFYALYGTTAEREGGYRMTLPVYMERFIHPDDRDAMMREISKGQFDAEESFAIFMQHRIIRSDGSVRNVVVRMKTKRDATGKILRIHGVNQDITGHT